MMRIDDPPPQLLKVIEEAHGRHGIAARALVEGVQPPAQASGAFAIARLIGLARKKFRPVRRATPLPSGSCGMFPTLAAATPLLILSSRLRDLRLDLGLELIRGAPELVERLAHLPRNLRQLLRPKDEQGQKEQEDQSPRSPCAS